MGGHAGHLYPQIWQGRSRERAGWGINVFQRASLAFPLLSGCSGAAWLACYVRRIDNALPECAKVLPRRAASAGSALKITAENCSQLGNRWMAQRPLRLSARAQSRCKNGPRRIWDLAS